MNGTTITELYPEAVSIAKGWFINKLSELPDVSEEFIESFKNNVENVIINMIDNSPHSLFEMFDSYSIHISIIVRQLAGKIRFNYRILPRDKKNASKTSNDRMTIERYAVEDAFEMLNERL